MILLGVLLKAALSEEKVYYSIFKSNGVYIVGGAVLVAVAWKLLKAIYAMKLQTASNAKKVSYIMAFCFVAFCFVLGVLEGKDASIFMALFYVLAAVVWIILGKLLTAEFSDDESASLFKATFYTVGVAYVSIMGDLFKVALDASEKDSIFQIKGRMAALCLVLYSVYVAFAWKLMKFNSNVDRISNVASHTKETPEPMDIQDDEIQDLSPPRISIPHLQSTRLLDDKVDVDNLDIWGEFVDSSSGVQEAMKLLQDSKNKKLGKSLGRQCKLTRDTFGKRLRDDFKALTSFDGEDDEPTEKLSIRQRLAKIGSVRPLSLTFPTTEMKTLEKDGLGLTEAPDAEEWHDADRVLLENNEFTKLPEEPICHKLIILSLRKNYKLRKIPSSFFINIPLLEHLDMSETGIMSLPKSLFELARLKRLFLQNCQFLMMLPPEVGNLKCLEVLDSEGTEIINLPVEIKELAALRCLRVSLYGCIDNEWKSRQTNGMIPFGVISALSQLRDVTIGVNPDDERWNPCVEGIMNEFGGLTNLSALRFYFPRVELLRDLKWNDKSMIYSSLETFRFIVGGHSKRIISRLPSDVDFELERWKWRKCLKYINGEGVPEDIKKVLQYATAFQLDRHMTVKKLTEFGIENMEHLKGCVVGECNEIQVIIDGNDIHNGQTLYESSGDRRIGLQSLEFLYIYYMKNLKSIWEGPVDERSLSLLKSLTLSTCPQLITIFTVELLENLHNLKDLTVRDCPAIKSLVICEEAFKQSDDYLPNLRTISLHYVPELVTISSQVCIAPNLEVLSLYNCPKLKCLSIKEVSSKHLRKIIGETDWWKALEWTRVQPNRFDGIFKPTKKTRVYE